MEGKKPLCPYFIGAGNDLYGVKTLEDVLIIKEYLSNIKEIADLPVFELVSADKKSLVFELTNEAKIASALKKEEEQKQKEEQKRLKEEERQRQLEELKQRARR